MITIDDRITVEKLRGRLEAPRRPLPRSRMAPALAYGRHRGPYHSDSRHAAVLLAIYRDQQGHWRLPLTRRPDSLQHHGGQICLPGGRLEPGEGTADAALREFQEELGVEPHNCRLCGELDTQYVYLSDNRVHPVVAILEPPRLPWQPDPAEVAEVIELPVSDLLDRGSRSERIEQRAVIKQGVQIGSFEFRAEIFQHDRHQIWGATAVILDQFASILEEICH